MIGKTQSSSSIGFGVTDELESPPNQISIHNPLPYGQYLYNVCVFAIKCSHNQMPIYKIKEKNGFWLPYVSTNSGEKWSQSVTSLTDLFINNQIKSTEERNLTPKVSIDLLQLASISRVQLPQEEFINRMTFFAKWKGSEKLICCQSNDTIEWHPIIDVIEGKVKNLLGSEVVQFAGLLNKSEEELKNEILLLDEMTLSEIFRFLPNNNDHQNENVDKNILKEMTELLEKSSIGRKEVQKLYSDFIQHCYPSFNMSYTSYRQYMKQMELRPMEEVVIQRGFRAMNYGKAGSISFTEFLLGMAALEPHSPHNQTRSAYIFRYYDDNSDGFLERSDFNVMISDIRKLENKPFDGKTIEEEVDKIMNIKDIANDEHLISLENFLTLVERPKLLNTSLLFRSLESLHKLIAKKNIYEPIGKESKRLSEGEESGKRCPKCRPKKYSLAVHSLRIERKGRFTEPKNILYTDSKDIKFHKENNLIETQRRHSTEVVNDNQSGPNEVLCRIRELGAVLKGKASEQTKKDLMLTTAKYLKYAIIKDICNQMIEILKSENRVLKVQSPAYVIGDIHGNLHDLIIFEEQLWRTAPQCMATNLLFAGDYVDRGDYGIECVLYLFCMKILNPNQVFLLRGNHEIKAIQKQFTFEKECTLKYKTDGQNVFEIINKTFDFLPIAAIIDESIYCAHGGIPYSVKTIEEINSIPCPLINVEQDSPEAWEILWNDPMDEQQFQSQLTFSHLSPQTEFVNNTKRSTAFYYSTKAVNSFLTTNHLTHIIRAHEAILDGYEFHINGKVITIFSCSKYSGLKNKAAVIHINGYGTDGIITIISLDT